MFATKETITCLQFNQDASCFIAGRVDGFAVYHADPFRELHRRTFADGFGVKVAAMLYRSSLVAFTADSTENLRRYVARAAGADPQRLAHLHPPAHVPLDGGEQQFQPNIVYLYDDAAGRILGRLRYRSEVFGIRLRKDAVCVALANQIYVHSLSDLSLLDVVNTADYAPPFAVSAAEDDFVLAHVPPGPPGRVGLAFYLFADADGAENRVVRRYVDAHRSRVTALELTQDGALLASGSEAGRTVRLFQTATQAPVAAWRRGADAAAITGIGFGPHGDAAAVCSTKGTVHVFRVPPVPRRPLRDALRPAAPGAAPRETRDATRFRPGCARCCAALGQGALLVLTAANEYLKAAPGAGGADAAPRARWLLV